ncbi:hypothetical protein LCGC14_2392960 [marine sediment metagenome]|uniref:Uncharacterized protein n=1 Tax=marine sediment metagenome TaxID=412755 RepID=A0A0F9BXM1_9ZZZZ
MPKLLLIKRFRGMITTGDVKDIPLDFCYEQQDMSNTLLDSINTRPGTTKSNTTAYAGGLLGLFQYRRRSGQYITLSANTNGEIRGD